MLTKEIRKIGPMMKAEGRLLELQRFERDSGLGKERKVGESISKNFL